MTELQFLIDLLLNHKLSPATKKLVAERIGVVEGQYSKAPTPSQRVLQPQRDTNGIVQAASTMAILNRDPAQDGSNSTPIVVAPTPALSPSSMALNRIVGGEVNTGRGSKGPRKF